ncbi:cytochrome P450 2U1-like [Ptychodera flava]|uniref:cytochrome P450 2U1-like n=1 Tax=Ptychodera flava TaxID=63121 RepID=UPI003969E7D9
MDTSDMSDVFAHIITFLVFCATVAFAVRFLHRQYRLPPGPWGLPFVGCLFHLGKRPEKTFNDWAKLYGDLFSVRLGSELVVILNSQQAIKDAYVKNASKFSARPSNNVGARLCNRKGLINAPWPDWKRIRTLSKKILQDLGFARTPTEQRIYEESEYLLNTMRQLDGVPTDVSYVLMNAVSNIMCSMVFGRRFDYDDQDFKDLLLSIHMAMTKLQGSALLTFIPILWYAPMTFKKELHHHYQNVVDYVKTILEKIRDERKHKPLSESFVGAYMTREEEYRNSEPGNKDIIQHFLGDAEHLPMTVVGLFAAGTHTTAIGLLWAILFLCLNQDIQERCFNEIKDNIGLDNAPSYSDKQKLPYIEAVIMEVYRRVSIVPLGLLHAVSDDVEIYGYTIPKGTMVMSNLWAVHMDEKNWERPEEFNPSRFLDDNGEIVNSERIMPFSIGPRDCVGSQLAKVEFFIFLTRLLQVFKFQLPDDVHPSLEGNPGLVNAPDDFKIIASIRQ